MIKLPFKRRPDFLSEIEDKWFHGLNFYEFDNGEVWVFVELLKMLTEAYNIPNVSRTLHGIDEEAEEEEEDDDDDNSTIAEMDCGIPQFVQTPALISANTDSSFHTPGSFVCGVQGISNQFLNGGLSIPYHSGKKRQGRFPNGGDKIYRQLNQEPKLIFHRS